MTIFKKSYLAQERNNFRVMISGRQITGVYNILGRIKINNYWIYTYWILYEDIINEYINTVG